MVGALIHLTPVYGFEPDPIHKGAAYLARAYEEGRAYAPLWIVKCLYAPQDIIRSAVLAALIGYQQMFGRSP